MEKYFNDDQIDHMRDLNKQPREAMCWCGWHPAGKCPNCPPNLTAADRAKVECPECHNSPGHRDPNGPITHNIKCSKR